MEIRVQTGSLLVDNCRIVYQENPGKNRDTLPVLGLHDVGSGSQEFRPPLDCQAERVLAAGVNANQKFAHK